MLRAPIAIVVVSGAVLLAAALGSSPEAAGGLQGDADCDSEVGFRDALAILLGDAPCRDLGDTDCDGAPSPADALRILRYKAGLSVREVAGCPGVGEAQPGLTAKPGQSDEPGPTEEGPKPSHTPTPTPTPEPSEGPEGPSPTPTPAPTRTPEPTPTPAPTPVVTGVEPDCQVFPEDNWWNTDISGYPVHPASDAIVARIGADEKLHPDFGTVWDGKPIGIPYVVVGAGQPVVPVSFYYADESDPGPYPIPPNVPVEGQPVGEPNTSDFGGDRHVIVVDDSACVLYEMFDAHPVDGGEAWEAGSGAVFDLTSNALRPEGWTSADAAGLPIFPGLVRYSEVQSGVIDHALRFTVRYTRRAYMHPATHYASQLTDADLPPMGMRFRMKASYDCSWASSEVQVICAALKKYGMFVADNGGDWSISGAPDPRWDDDRIGDLKEIPGSAFEVVDTGEAVVTG